MFRKFSIFIFAVTGVVLVSGQSHRWRDDGKCGPGNLAPDGKDADCEHIPPFPTCCQRSGHCGWDCDGSKSWKTSKWKHNLILSFTVLVLTSSVEGQNQAAPSVPVRTTPKPVFTSNGRYRSDGRCGAANPLEDGVTPAECDPNSEFWCCSEHGYCGGTQEHCYCDTCINYRPIKVELLITCNELNRFQWISIF